MITQEQAEIYKSFYDECQSIPKTGWTGILFRAFRSALASATEKLNRITVNG